MTYEKILHNTSEPTALIRYGKRSNGKQVWQKCTPRNPRWINDVQYVLKHICMMDDPEETFPSAPSGTSVKISESEAKQIKAQWS